MFDYGAGKLDWLAAGNPTEGTNPAKARAGAVARHDVPTCRVDEPLGDVAARVAAAGFDACVVVNDAGVVFGLLRSAELARDAGAIVGDVMRPGPSTFRPHVMAGEMARYMVKHDLTSSPVTRSDGTLVGLLYRDDVTTYLHEHGDDE
ncbi:MAG TPA: CBS domain-containing protein [Actinomycetota bacterium]|nr:CBS domain-containing protein [Actinomycetota bacterium]